MNIDLSINIGISIGESICINTNIHMMMCIRRNTCSSITLYFLIRIPPDLEPKRGVALEDFPNSLWAGAEAVTDTRMQPKPYKKTKVSRRMPEQFCCFGCLVFLFFVFLDFCFFVFFFWVFWFYIAKPKTKNNTNNQKPKIQNTNKPKHQKPQNTKTKLCRHSP